MAEFIAVQRAEHGIPYVIACRALGVSRAWFYKWRHGDFSVRRARRAELDAAVRRAFVARKGTAGSPKIADDLRGQGWRVSTNTVAVSMRAQGLVARPKKKRRGLTRPGKNPRKAPDLVRRDWSLREQPNQAWVGDLTEIPCREGPFYLAACIDLHSRRVSGFAMGARHDAELAKAALCMGIAVRGGDVAGLVMHTDQGGEYTGELFATACRNLDVTQSMGRTGSALDNAVAESFNSTLEFECFRIETDNNADNGQFATRAQARQVIAAWIEDYNHTRRHSAIGNIPPVAYEQQQHDQRILEQQEEAA